MLDKRLWLSVVVHLSVILVSRTISLSRIQVSDHPYPSIAIQLLKSTGFTQIIAYASAKHTEALKALGATAIIDRSQVPEKELTAAVSQICGQVNIVYDAVFSAEGQEAGYAALAENGHLLSVRAIPDAYASKDESRGRKVTSVYGSPHMPNNKVFGKIMYEKLAGLLGNGTIVVSHNFEFLELGLIVILYQPTMIEELPGGLGAIVDGLDALKEGKVSGKKLIISL